MMAKINAMVLMTLLCAAALCALSACSDDRDADAATTPALPGSGATASGATSPAADPLFAVVTQISPGGGMPTSYVSVTGSLVSTTPVTLDGAMAVVGRALVASQVGAGTLFVSGAGPELTKYTVDASNKLVEAGKIGFPGVMTIGEYASQLQFVSPTKAYYFDTRVAQVFVWNPTTLTITKTIDLRELLVPDAILTFSSVVPVRRADKIVLGAGWRSSNNQRVIKQVGLVVLDTAADTATVLRDDRCGYVRDAVEGKDGRVYLATEAWGSAVHRLNPSFAPAPCLLRTDAALTTIDKGFYRDLNALGGGVTGSLVASRDGKVFTRVLEEAATTITPMTAARALASMPVWRWAELTLGDAPSATKVAEAPLGTGSLVVLDTKDKRFVAEIRMAGTDLVDLTSGIGSVSIATPGNTFSLVQVR